MLNDWTTKRNQAVVAIILTHAAEFCRAEDCGLGKRPCVGQQPWIVKRLAILRSLRLIAAGSKDCLDERFGDRLGDLIRQRSSETPHGFDGQSKRSQVIAAIAAQEQMQPEQQTLSQGQLTVEVVGEEFGDFPAIHRRFTN
jgi:hypothetical protein